MHQTAQWFAEGQKQHQAQRFADAERLYRCVVDEDPAHAAAWHLLGMVCLAQNKLSDATENLQRALMLAPSNADALTQFGIALARQNRVAEAEAKFRHAIEIQPDFAKAHNNLGVALTQMGRKDEGFACYRKAVELDPDYAEAQFNLGMTLSDRHQTEAAIECYEQALRLRPDYVDALFSLGLLYVNERRVAKGVLCLEQAVRLVPTDPEAHNSLGVALADLGRFEAAVASCDESLRLRPFDAKTHVNRGNALSSLGRIHEAIASYDFAVGLQPDYVNARWNRALAWLTQGNYKQGWPEYEWRWKRTETRTRHFPEPRWDGGALEGKTILLWCEQGLGDTIQFVRYASLVKNRGATVWLECQPHMAPMLSTCKGIDRVIVEGDPLPSGFDCQAPLMSLPLLCGTTLSTVPSAVPYLSPDPGQLEFWRKEFSASPQFKVGVAWQGNPQHRFDQHRSYSVQWLADLASIEGVQLCSLQKGPGTEQLAEARFPITDLRPRLDAMGGGLHETAAAIAALDLVITCDSALAHLAGALGVPVWVPLSIPTDWRWLLVHEDSPWYPTMRLFRQDKPCTWRPVFDRMRDELQRLCLKAARPRHELTLYFDLLSTFNNKNLVALDLAHNVFLVGAVLARKPERILELGVGSAYLTNSLMNAIAYNRKGCLTSVDNWCDWGGNEPAFASGLRDAGVNLVVSGEEEFVRAASDDAFDFLVSDADHFRSASWLDQHLRIVQHDGFLFFHDTNQADMFPGLATLESQIRDRGLPHFHFKESSRPEERCQRGWLFVINKKK